MFTDRRVLVILNPSSGTGKGGALLDSLEAELRGHGAREVAVRVTRGPDDAIRWAAAASAEGFEVVIAGGGDGTVTAVAHGVHRSGARPTIGILPLGTGNGMARVLGLPLEPPETLAALAVGRVVKVDAVEITSHDAFSLLFFGAGLDAKINRDADADEKARFGALAYVKATFDNLRRAKNHAVSIWLDSRQTVLRAHTVTVLNATRLDLLGMRVGPDAQPHDGLLKVTVMRSPALFASLGHLLRLANKEASRAELETAKRIRIEAVPPLPVQVDGDVIGETPLEARVLPAALRFIAAEDYGGGGETGGE